MQRWKVRRTVSAGRKLVSKRASRAIRLDRRCSIITHTKHPAPVRSCDQRKRLPCPAAAAAAKAGRVGCARLLRLNHPRQAMTWWRRPCRPSATSQRRFPGGPRWWLGASPARPALLPVLIWVIRASALRSPLLGFKLVWSISPVHAVDPVNMLQVSRKAIGLLRLRG